MELVLLLYFSFGIAFVWSERCSKIPVGLNKQRKGVDITTLDLYPLSSSKGDTGFRQNVIDFTCSQKKTWQNFNIPDQIANVADLSSALAIDSVEIFKSNEEISKNMATNVGFNSVLKGFFSASGSYKKMVKTINNKDRYLEQVTSSVTTMSSDFEPYWIIDLGRTAAMFVKKFLKPKIDKTSVKRYQEFIRYFGTHLFNHAKFGGSICLSLQTSKSYFEKHSDSHISAQAEATFFNLFKISGGHSSSRSFVKKEFNQATRKTIRYYGGNTNLLSKNNGIDKWQPTVKLQPWLLSGRLVPIYDLIQDDDDKRESMRIAVQAHVDKAYLRELIRSLPSSFSSTVNKYKLQINILLRKAIPDHNKVLALGKKVSAEFVVPSWFLKNTKLCYRWYADGNGGQCGGGVSRNLCAKPGAMTAYYRDDTDRRGGGCRMSWGLMSPSKKSPSWFKKVKICYRWYPDGNGGQCGGGVGRNLCAPVNSWTKYYRDDTDRRGGGCRMSWMISIPSDSPEWIKRVKLCFYWYPDGDGGQCGGGVSRHLCANANSWTRYYRDDTDRRGGGCRMSWGIKL